MKTELISQRFWTLCHMNYMENDWFDDKNFNYTINYKIKERKKNLHAFKP